MISIIIPTYNEEKNLQNLIDTIKKNNDKSDYEIIVVDNGSSDNTKNIALKEKCNFLHNPKKTKVGLSRNMGAKAAKGDILYFIDADWRPLGKNHLRLIENYFVKHSEKKCATPLLKRKSNTGIKKLLSIENSFPIGSSEPGAYIFRKEFFFEFGGFEDSLGFGEDREVQKKVKNFSGWIREIELSQDMVGSLKTVYKQGKWYGKGFLNYFKKTKEISHFISMIFWLSWVPLALLGIFYVAFNYLLIANIFLMILISLRYFIYSRNLISFLIPIVKITRSYGEFIGLTYSLFKK
jgi:glycosyltransferase involved in cell wall biosynthesis